jgi:segregation and condensation protein B
LYGTSSKFMDYFGINDLKEMPTPKDFLKEENEIGETKSEE